MTFAHTSARLALTASLVLSAGMALSQTSTATPRKGEASTVTQGQPNATNTAPGIGSGGQMQDQQGTMRSGSANAASAPGTTAPPNAVNGGMTSRADNTTSMNNGRSTHMQHKMKRKNRQMNRGRTTNRGVGEIAS